MGRWTGEREAFGERGLRMYTIRCFGRVSVEDESGESVGLRSRKHLGLLLFLASHTKRTHTRERLAALFWDTPRELARHSLSQGLYDIRSSLPGLEIITSVDQLRLEDPSIGLESVTFEEAIRGEEYGRAVSLYSGQFAPHFEQIGSRDFEDWVEGERHRLATLAELALVNFVRMCDETGRWGEMCVAALRLLEIDPMNEPAHRAVMRGLWLQGDQGAALRHFEKHRASLERDLPDGLSEETEELLRRIRSSRPVVREPDARGLEELELVGRSEEFEKLNESLARAEEGSARFVVVRGEPGIGKTRLIDQFRRVLELRGVSCVESRCYPAESDVAYGPVVDGLEGSVAALAEASETPEAHYFQLGHLFPEHFPLPESSKEIDPATGRRRLFEEVSDVVRRLCSESPVGWIVEDGHWIDGASAALLHYLIRRLRDHPFLLVVACRSGMELTGAARELLEAGGGEARVLVELPPLSAEEVRRLVELAGGDDLPDEAVARVQKLAGGNPFFVLEILRGLPARPRFEESRTSSKRLLTDRIRELLEFRFRGLSPGAMQILETVAVLERHASPSRVASLAGSTPEFTASLSRKLYRTGLLRDAGETIEFCHDLSREFVYRSMGELPRAAYHLAAAELLSKQVPDVSPGTLARHFLLGGDTDRACEYALRSAEQYESSFAHEEALRMAEIALSQATTSSQKSHALEMVARAELALGRLTEAQSHLADLIEVQPDVSPEKLVELRLKIAQAKVEMSDWDAATEALEEASSVVAGLGTPERLEYETERLYLGLKLAMRRKEDGVIRKVVGELRELVNDDAVAPIPPSSRLLAHCGLGVYYTFYESSSKAVQYLEGVGRNLGDVNLESRLRWRLLRGVLAARLAQWDMAEFHLKKALSVARRHNDAVLTFNLLNNLGCCALEQGKWQEAEALYAENYTLAEVLPERLFLRISPIANVGNLYLYTGRPNKAAREFQRGLEVCESIGAATSKPDLLASLGLTALHLGDINDANSYSAVLSESESDTFGVPDRFKIAWLSAILEWLSGGEARKVSRKLVDVAEEERKLDLVSYYKLCWIARIFGSQLDHDSAPSLEDSKSEALVNELRAYRLGWFVYFANRFMGHVRRLKRNA